MNNFNFKKMLQKIVLLSIALLMFSVYSFAQSTANPDTVCAGSNVYYKIQSPTAGSTFTWGVYGTSGTLINTTQTDSIRISWANNLENDQIWVFETNAAGCKGDTAKLNIVRVAPPTAQFDNATLCNGNILKIIFTGYSPYSVQYTLNGNPVTQSGITQNPYSVGTTAGTYVLTQVSDKHCINNTLTGTINVIIGQPLNTLQIIHN